MYCFILQIAAGCYAKVNIKRALSVPVPTRPDKRLRLLSTFSTNIHENQRQKQTVVPAWRRKSVSGTPAAYTTPITTYVWGLHFNNKQNRTDSAGVIKGKIQECPPHTHPFFSLADCAHSWIGFPFLWKVPQRPDSTLFIGPGSKRVGQRCPNINYMFVHFWVTHSWPGVNLHWKGCKKSLLLLLAFSQCQ